MIEMTAEEKYDAAIEWLNINYPFFLTLVLNLGYPEWTTALPTAAVGLEHETDDPSDFKFFINPDYVENLSVEEFAAVMGHETLHIALNHLIEARKKDIFPKEQQLVITHEVIVNDRLTTEGFVLPEGCFHGENVLGLNTSPFSSEDVYDMLENNQNNENQKNDDQSNENDSSNDPQENNNDSSSGEQESSESTGNDSSDSNQDSSNNNSSSNNQNDGETSETGSGSNSCIGDLTEEQAEAITNIFKGIIQQAAVQNSSMMDQLSNELKQDLDLDFDTTPKSSMAGSSYTENIEDAANRIGVSVNWMKILQKVNPDVLQKKGRKASQYRASWTQPRRNIAHMYPKVMVPQMVRKGNLDKKSSEGKNKELIVLALDLSSSIPRSLVNPLVQLAKSVPQDLIEVKVCTFSTRYVPFDLKSNQNKLANGGTDFSCVEDFVRLSAKELKVDYPKSIICITDGEADFGFTKPVKLENWTWLTIKKDNTIGENYYQSRNWLKNKMEITLPNTFYLGDFVENWKTMNK